MASPRRARRGDYAGSAGSINANTLGCAGTPFFVAKSTPASHGGFRVGDKAVRPSGFRTLDRDEVAALLQRETESNA